MAILNHKSFFFNTLLVRYSSILLLALVVFAVFVIPLFPVQYLRDLYSVFYSIIFFTCVAVLKSKRKLLVIAAVIAFAMEWVAVVTDASILLFLSRSMNVLFFVLVVIKLIIQIAGYRQVNIEVITEAITGYLLMGLMFSILVFISIVAEPGAYSFSSVEFVDLTDVNYYTFVTMSTLGYGDLLPVMPVSKSLALFITISGQLYLAIIIATLVGKFLSQDLISEE